MLRLEKIVRGMYEVVRWPDDVAELKSAIPQLAALSDFVVQTIYENWSEEHFCASWLIVDANSIDDFKAWLLTEVTEEGR